MIGEIKKREAMITKYKDGDIDVILQTVIEGLNGEYITIRKEYTYVWLRTHSVKEAIEDHEAEVKNTINTLLGKISGIIEAENFLTMKGYKIVQEFTA